jgi:hypothetical protein
MTFLKVHDLQVMDFFWCLHQIEFQELSRLAEPSGFLVALGLVGFSGAQKQ